ncbi:MAG: hypothetical protein ABIJ56_02830 [Pseudomonadota bacterium]
MGTGKRSFFMGLCLAAAFGWGCNGSTNGDDDAGDDDAGGEDLAGDDAAVDAVDDPVDDGSVEDADEEDGIEPPAGTWAKTYGGREDDEAYCIENTTEGGYVAAGATNSYGEGGSDVWVVKLDAGGRIEWEKTYGGPADDEARSIRQSPRGGYIVAGSTRSFGVGSDGAVWVLRLDEEGAVQWQKTFDGGQGAAVALAGGGGYAVAGGTAQHGAGGSDAWVIKLDEDGSTLWQNTYGDSDSETAYAITNTSDVGFAVAGWTSSFGAGWADFWVLKLDGDGTVVWAKAYGGSEAEDARFIMQTPDDGFVVAGWTVSFGAGEADAWVLKLDSDGGVQWQSAFGGSGIDRAFSVSRASDGAYVVAGRTESFGSGGADVMVLGLDSEGALQWQKTFGSSYDEEARGAAHTRDGRIVAAGKDGYYGTAAADFWVMKMDTEGAIAGSCPEGMTGSGSAAGAATSVTPEDTPVSASPTGVDADDTAAAASDSAAGVETQCEG